MTYTAASIDVLRSSAAPPPLELWGSFRSALGDALTAAQRRDDEIAALRQRVADAEDGRAAAQAAQAAMAAQAAQQQYYGAVSPLPMMPSMPQTAAASASALSFARQGSFRGALPGTPTATQRSLKPQRPGSSGGGGIGSASRNDFAPVSAAGAQQMPMPPPMAMPPPPPPPPAHW